MWSVGSNAGFTLIELLVVLTVLALVLAVTPPLLIDATDSARYKSAQRRLISGLRYARSEAANLQRVVTVHINVKRGTIQVAGRQQALSIPADVVFTLVTAQQEQLSEYEGTIRFYPDGSSTGGQVRFSRGEQTSSIDVNWLTGQVNFNRH